MNLFNFPNNIPKELTDILVESNNIRIERIVSMGQTTDWYDQNDFEFVALLTGSAKIEFENDKIVTLNSGDTIIIRPHEKHKVIYTSINPACCWLCVFFNESE